MKTLKYKGYAGSVEFSAEDDLLFGEILGIDGLVTYEGKTMEELKDSFHEAVEDYLAFCEDHNWKPQKSYSGAFNVRISPETHRDIANLSAEEGITINAFVKRVLAEAVKRPSVNPSTVVAGYDAGHAPEPAMLREPEGPKYGALDTVEITIPHKDIEFAKELAARMGWDITISS